MRLRFYHGVAISFLALFSLPSFAQIQTYEDQIQQELLRRGLDENELRALLYEKNIDLDNIQYLNADQILELEQTIDELQQITTLRDLQQVSDTSEVDNQTALLDTSDISPTTVDADSIQASIYGHHLFIDGRISLIEAGENYAPPVGFTIASGDELGVAIYSRNSQLDRSFRVGSDGAIRIRDGVVRVFVAGLTMDQARAKLEATFKRYYRFASSEFSLSLVSARSINIQVLGEVQNPGNYIVSGLNSVLNVIGGAGGFTDNGSVRKIQVIKRNGNIESFDLYGPLFDPGSTSLMYLEDGDLIHVPAAGTLVEMSGAVERSYTYELLDHEGLRQAIAFAGGLQRGAYLTSMKVLRFEEDRRVVKTVPYAQLLKNNETFLLHNGDVIEVAFIEDELENYVRVEGAVRNPGEFERTPGMRLSDLVTLGRLKPGAKTDFAYLRRTNIDGTIRMIPVSIDQILQGSDPLADIVLDDKDELTVWELERFTDNKYIKVAGAVRFPEQFAYDEGGSLRASDVIEMAGGLRRDAAEFAHVHRLDPLNPNDLTYFRLDLLRLMNNPNAPDNIVLEPFDSIHIYSKNDFLDEVYIRVAGAVNNPGEFAYGTGMNLRDAIILAGGFRRSSATNQIEISRVVIKDNQPTKTTVQTTSISREDLTRFGDNEEYFELEPFDNVFVRYVPEFELQQNVTIEGEVTLPGEYSLVKNNETVYDVIQRAGGLTEEAFTPAATLLRAEDSLGFLVMQLDQVMTNPGSHFNYVLKGGDEIFVPKRQDWVTIVGSAQYLVQNPDLKRINTPYHEGKNAEYYVDFYAGGFADEARTDKIFVKYANGQVKVTKRKFPFGKKHPEVLPGSVIQIGKKLRDLNAEGEEENVNWTRVLGDSVAQAMSILTLILLVQRLD